MGDSILINMKRVVGVLLFCVGIIFLIFSNTLVLKNNNEIVEKPVVEERKYLDVIHYLKEKYQEDFEVTKLIKEYCVEYVNNKIIYSDNCDNTKIKNTLYKAKKNNSNIEFFVKKVSYDNNLITTNQSFIKSGYYDNYVNFVHEKKIIEDIRKEIKDTISNIEDISIFDGIGIVDINLSNAYLYLDNKITIEDLNITTTDFVEKINDKFISVSLKKKNSVTKENIKAEIKELISFGNVKLDNLFIKDIVFEYQEDKYIKYNYDLKIIEIKKGKNKYNNESKSTLLYDKVICLNDEYEKDCINYNDFIALSEENFIF